jgi:hypothetical protein
LKRALAYTAGGLRYLPRTAGEASWAEMETEERDRSRGNLRQPVWEVGTGFSA